MNEIINSVWSVCNQFINNGKGKHVTLNDTAMKRVAENIKTELNNMKDNWWGYPKCFKKETYELSYKMMYYELLADSINYQYWYGRHDIRPNGACSNEMYKILDTTFSFVIDEISPYHGYEMAPIVTKIFIENISLARFPNIENRIKHIKEVLTLVSSNGYDTVRYLVDKISNNDITINEFLTIIISKLPGYAEDIFLKRAFLLPIMLYRRLQWFKDDIDIVPVPADYQIPKVLEGLGCINYGYILSDKIQGGELIISGSLEECEIRAATILACKRLSELSGCKMCDIDTYLWLKRNEIDKPFHLTITTDY